jgi:ABC-type multidrug transport system ATPase subunit
MSVVEVKANGLSKAYKRNWALRQVSFTVGAGITGLLGPNGAGKTTLLNILATLLEPTSGKASIGGYDVVSQRREVRQILGFLPQDFGLYDGLTAYEFLDYMSVLKGIGNRRQCVERSLEQVGLENHSKKRVGTFSGGMRQRLGIAQALLNSPPLLLVDEPTVGLDPAERNRFRQMLTQWAIDHTIILSTHLVEDIALTAGRVMVIHLGQIRFNGAVSDLVRSAQGKVWSARLTRHVLDAVRQHYLITHLEPDEDEFVARFLSDTPPSLPAESVSPTLEDAYLHLVQGGL